MEWFGKRDIKRPAPSLENLEDRRLLAASLDVTAGVLSYLATTGVANALTVSTAGGVMTFQDTGEAAIALTANALAAGWTAVNANTVHGPAVNAINSINLADENDTLTLASLPANLAVHADLGPGVNTAIVNGTAAADTFTIGASDTHLLVGAGSDTIDLVSAQQLNVLGGDGADSITFNNLAGSGLGVLDLDAGADAAADTVAINGTNAADSITVGPAGAGLSIQGLAALINLTGTTTADTLTINGLAGNDTIAAVPGTNASVQLVLNGGAGDDYLTGDGTLVGGAGNDTLAGIAGADSLDGGAGNDLLVAGTGASTLSGGAGEDTLVGGAGGVTMDGGTGFDTIMVSGTSDADRIDIAQTSPTSITATVNGVAQTYTLVAGTVENVLVQAGGGEDIIRVTQADALTSANSLQVTVDGGPGAANRLVVVDDGTGDMTLLRKPLTAGSGSVTVGSLKPVVYTNVQAVQPISGAGGQVMVVSADPYEYNDDLANATYFGAGQTINVQTSLDPAADAPFNAPPDVDVYRLQPNLTGVLDAGLTFTRIPTVTSGRPGLPGNGDLTLQVLDAAGHQIAIQNALTSGQRIVTPAVAGQTYFVRVSGTTGGAVNNYGLSVNNEAAPSSASVQINPADDTGCSTTDRVTRDATPRLVVQTDLQSFFDRGIAILTPGQATVGNVPGVAVEIFDNGVHAGWATLDATSGASKSLFNYTFTTGQIVTSNFVEGVNGAAYNVDNKITAAVRVFDGATPAANTGRAALSDPLVLRVDTTAPDAPSAPKMLPGSDSSLPNDNVTSVTSPAFDGTAEANSTVRIFATDASGVSHQVGQAIAGSDATDGITGNGIGRYEITVGPLAYGAYTIKANAEDAAGNISALSSPDTRIHISSFALSLAAPVSYPSLSQPMAVATGDLTGDGRIDIVSVDKSGNISTFINRGHTGFQRAMRTSVGGLGPVDLALGDVNGDGKLDVVTANSGSGSVSVLFGNGDGTFGVPRVYKAFKNPSAVRLGDINGDGMPDIIVTNTATHKMSYLLNKGNGTFGALKSFNIPGVSPIAFDMADLNGDGKLDIVVVNDRKSLSLDVLFGNGAGGFRKSQRLRVGLPATSVRIADVDNDGNLDIVASNATSNFVSVLQGKGRGLFYDRTRINYIGANLQAQAITTADLNFDGYQDLIIANAKGDTLGVMLGNGNGTFQTMIRFQMGKVIPGQAHAMATADFNNDGLIDIAVASAGTDDVNVFFNSQPGHG
ncbi:MAG: beta strand repeat-containing protein [Tepidisphaerales bacterium]